jgi:hypothetical protein
VKAGGRAFRELACIGVDGPYEGREWKVSASGRLHTVSSRTAFESGASSVVSWSLLQAVHRGGVGEGYHTRPMLRIGRIATPGLPAQPARLYRLNQ